MLGGMSSYFAQVIPLHLDYLRNGRDSPGGSGDVALIPRCRMKIPHAVEELSPLRPDAAKLKKKRKKEMEKARSLENLTLVQQETLTTWRACTWGVGVDC